MIRTIHLTEDEIVRLIREDITVGVRFCFESASVDYDDEQPTKLHIRRLLRTRLESDLIVEAKS